MTTLRGCLLEIFPKLREEEEGVKSSGDSMKTRTEAATTEGAWNRQEDRERRENKGGGGRDDRSKIHAIHSLTKCVNNDSETCNNDKR